LTPARNGVLFWPPTGASGTLPNMAVKLLA